MVADSEMSIEETDRGVKKAITAMEVPPFVTMDLAYDCILQETGKTLRIPAGASSERLHTAGNGDISVKDIFVTATPENLYLSQFVANPSKGGSPTFSKVVARVKRGVVEAQFKFMSRKNGVSSIACALAHSKEKE